MPSNLSHCLAAMATCGAVNIIMGMPPLSGSVFFSGLAAMLINLDYSPETGLNRTPWGHSVLSCVMWPIAFLMVMVSSAHFGVFSVYLAFELSLAFAVAYVTHIMLDFFTIEGILIPKDRKWASVNCSVIKLQPKKESSALLNIYLCIPSAVAIMTLVGLAP